MLAGLWEIVWHYTLGIGFVALGAIAYVVSVLLQTQIENIPWVGPWLANNIKHIREIAVIVIVLGFSHSIVYGIGVKDGKARTQAVWDKAEQAAVTQAVTARKDAERVVKRIPAGGLRNDPNNRDNR